MRLATLLLAAAAIVLAGCVGDPDDGYDFRFEAAPTVEPAAPAEGQPFTIVFRARNGGDYDADDVRWTLERDGTVFDEGFIDLDEHESREVRVLVSGDTEGTHVWRVVLDRRDRFDEDDEGDNDASLVIEVGPAPGSPI